MSIPKYASIATLVLMLAGCGEAIDPGTEATEPPATTTSTTSTTTTTMPGDEQVPSPMIDDAVGDLARRLGVDVSEIEVVTFEVVTWSDGSLGCPEPGKMYTQALVDGYRIILGHDDRIYLYHGADGEKPFICPSDEKDGGHDFVPPPGFDD